MLTGMVKPGAAYFNLGFPDRDNKENPSARKRTGSSVFRWERKKSTARCL